MLKVILILFIGVSSLPKTTPCVDVWGQCGGQNWAGSPCCDQLTCTYSNPYYSQCLPASSTLPSSSSTDSTSTSGSTPSSSTSSSSTDSTSTSGSTSSSSTPGCSAIYSQCGGQNWVGPTCCDGSTCTYSNPYYSQCLPASSTLSSPSSTDSTSTSGSTPSSSTSTSGSTSSSSTSASTTIASTSSSSTSSTTQGCSIVYAQCGGIGWNGPTSCCSASTCTYGNDYYWQCLPSSSSSSSSTSGVSSATTASSSSSSGGSVSSTTIASSSSSSSGNDNSQSGITTRYWDCCKASCGWPGKASVTSPVQTCAVDGVAPVGNNTQSVCNGGSAYMCNNQQPWNVSSTLSYGYAAADISGQSESDWCCACYSLIFTSGPVVGKQLIVQVTNTGGDLGNNQFDLQMPGGGFGIFDGCTNQFGSTYSWGATYGGVSQRSNCTQLPVVLQSGCYWRFDWFMNADNPTMTFTQVTCPSVLTANTQCIRV